MELVKPSHEIKTEIDGEKILKNIENAGRTCYKSEDLITEDSARKFVQMVIKRGHLSVIEHENISVKFVCDRGVTHEIVRHRLAAYSQECVTGDTKVTKYHTIKELYDKQKSESPYDKTHNKTLRLKSVNENGLIIPNKFKEVFYKGKQKVYEVKTKLGYSIKSTLSHRYKNKNGVYDFLENFVVGDLLFVNERPSLVKVDDNILSTMYLFNEMTPSDIAEYLQCPINSVYLKLKKLGIFESHLNDKNKEKYNKFHTKDSYDKMRKTIINQYKNGGPKGNIKAQILKENIDYCELCNNKNTRLEVHHKDKDINNNDYSNIIKLCNHCHNLLHKEEWFIGKKEILDEIISIKYVGKEDTYDIEMNEPYHNYVANGFIVHNSTRYCNYSGGVTFVIPPWTNLKEGNYDPKEYWPDEISKDMSSWLWFKAMLDAEHNYTTLLREGWSPQQARSVLPNSLKTEIVMTANIREWRHVFTLRCAKASHPQMNELMIPLLNEFKKKIPILFDDINQ